MKTNKVFSILMMLVIVLGAAVTLSSCNKDDDGNVNLLLGTWEEVNQESYKNGKIVPDHWRSGGTWTFQKDGTLKTYSYSGKYEYNSPWIRMIYHGYNSDEDYKVEILELTDKNLVWKKIYEDTEYDYQIVYLQKIKSEYDDESYKDWK